MRARGKQADWVCTERAHPPAFTRLPAFAPPPPARVARAHLHGAYALEQVRQVLVDCGLRDAQPKGLPVQHALKGRVHAVHDDERDAAVQDGVLGAHAEAVAYSPAHVMAEIIYRACDAAPQDGVRAEAVARPDRRMLASRQWGAGAGS